MSVPVEISISQPSIEPLECELLDRLGVTVNVLRLDKCHPLLTGNKWFKLKYNLLEIQQQADLPILSFGGAYSNHLHALAAAGKLLGMRTIGIVRGEIPEPLNPVLNFARQQGMTLWPVSREDYRRKQDIDFQKLLRARFGDYHLLPEGGSNSLAIKGCEEIAALLRWSDTAEKRVAALCCGTGTTMAGLVSGLSAMEYLPDRSVVPEVLGVSVLKGKGYMQSEVAGQLAAQGCTRPVDWWVDDTHHCGGYARTSPDLLTFLEEFAGFSDIPLEPVYTGKLFFALFRLIEEGTITRGTEVMAIHSGGIHN